MSNNILPISGSIIQNDPLRVVYAGGSRSVFLLTPPVGSVIKGVCKNGVEVDLLGRSGGDFVAYDKSVVNQFDISVSASDTVTYEFELISQAGLLNAGGSPFLTGINEIQLSTVSDGLTCTALRRFTGEVVIRLTYQRTSLGNQDFAFGISSVPLLVNTISSTSKLGEIHFKGTSYDPTRQGIWANGAIVQTAGNIPAQITANTPTELAFELLDNGGNYDVNVYYDGIVQASYSSTVPVGTYYPFVGLDNRQGTLSNIGFIGNFI